MCGNADFEWTNLTPAQVREILSADEPSERFVAFRPQLTVVMNGLSWPATERLTSFGVRITPRRAGTFIYHTHLHDYRQLSSGLYGPLIVTEPGITYDAAVDHVIVLSSSRTILEWYAQPFVDVSSYPTTVTAATLDLEREAATHAVEHDMEYRK